MIRNQWYAVLASRELKEEKPVGVVRLGEKMAFWRDQAGKVCCIADKCCHRGASLSCGEVVGDHLACPFHGMQYDQTGKVAVIPANGKNTPVADYYAVKHYTVAEKYGLIWLWWGETRESYPELPFFEDLKKGWDYGSFSDHWPVHYTRAVENQLDAVHLPFVHGTTIGKGMKTLVNGPVVVREGTLLKFFVKNEMDRGTAPQKAEEITDYLNLPQLQFQFPNIWMNVIGDKVRAFAAFMPVDEENTIVHLRFYHKLSGLPLIKELISKVGILFSVIVLRQDKRVVVTQIPVKTELAMGEKLIPGDRPIIEFRKVRNELAKQNREAVQEK